MYHASSNFIAGSKLILLVIYFTALGGDVLFLLWSLIAGVSYIAAPIMYNPKPSPKAMVEGFKQFTRWLKARDEIFDRKVRPSPGGVQHWPCGPGQGMDVIVMRLCWCWWGRGLGWVHTGPRPGAGFCVRASLSARP